MANRLPLAIVVAVAAAGVATFLLRPRSGLIQPAPVEATAYFSKHQIERARDFRAPQRALGLAGLALSGGTLALVALAPPRRLRRALERAGRRPYRGAVAVGAGLSIGLALVTLPLSAVGHERARHVGLATQTWGPWLGDVGKSLALGAALAGGGAAIGLGTVRRFPRHWWAPGAVAVVGLSAFFVLVSPVLIDPIFNKFTPLPGGNLRSEVLDLARRAGVDVGQVYRVDASRRSTGVNAYVTGIGHTKRVVLFDTLIEKFPPEQVRAVVAHELGHVKHRDVPRGLLWLAIVAPAGMYLVQQLSERIARRTVGAGALPRPHWAVGARGRELATPATLPAVVLSLALVSFAGGVAGNMLSRRVEARADVFSLDLTKDPAAFIGLERSLSVQNVGDPQPPAVLQSLFGTHPEAVERIGIGLAWARRR